VLVTEAREGRNVGGAVGKDDGIGCRGIHGAVVLVEEQVFVRSKDFRRTEQRDQPTHQRRAAEAGANGRGGRQEAAPA
jgi:hypothetical protein